MNDAPDRALALGPHPLAIRAGDLLLRLRDDVPRVHCVTNAVAQAFTANVLLALGAVPSMTLSPDEIEDFVVEADALLVNLGTFDEGRRQATATAIGAAKKAGIPWVLDPVFIDRSPKRAAFARDLLDMRPDIIRMNQDEAETLFSGEARDQYGFHRFTVATTGPEDVISDGERSVSLSNGHGLMAKVTAMGCAGGAVMAAFRAVHDDGFEAAAAALLVMGIAGEMAGETAAGPGSFKSSFLDELAALTPDTIMSRARIT